MTHDSSWLPEMKEAVKTLNRWAKEYYENDAPSVSDATYDALYDRLVDMEKRYGTVLPDSPTKRVGGEPLKGFEKYTHAKRLYSMDKVQSFGELKDWIGKIKAEYRDADFTVEYKYDGLNISLSYDDGELIRAVTRGNGIIGEIVTEQIKTVRNLPLSIPYKGRIDIQGEGYMRLSALRRFNERYPEEALKNARNGAAGAIRNLDPSVTAKRNLSMVLYSLNYGLIPDVDSQTELVSFFESNGFSVNELFEIAETYEEIKAIIEREAEKRPSLDYLIDGIVIKVDDFALREEIGYTEKFPKWAVAFKFEAEEVTTRLLAVEWNVGRTGKITPLAHLAPVELCGATIKRATLNNIGDIERKGIKIGSDVYIRRSNDVIPEILGIAEDVSGSRDIVIPEKCPSCGADTVFCGAHLFCPNETGCRAQIIGRIVHFCGRDACNVDGISEKTVSQMVDKLGVARASDLWDLTRERLAELDGFKEKKTENFFAALEKVRDIPLANFIFALGIDNVGLKTAKDLAEVFGSVEALSRATAEELTAIEDVGDAVARSITEFFSDEENETLICKLKEKGIDPVFSQKTSEGKFKGMKFVLTGALENYTRSQASAIIESLGGETSSSVSKNTDVVLAGADAGSKLQKAEKLGLEIWDEVRFRRETE